MDVVKPRIFNKNRTRVYFAYRVGSKYFRIPEVWHKQLTSQGNLVVHPKGSAKPIKVCLVTEKMLSKR